MKTAFRSALSEVSGLMALAAPLVAGLAASTGVSLVDTAMLGPLGAVPLAAVSLASSVAILFYAALYGFAGPVGLFAGRCHGGGDLPGMGRVARHGAWLSVLGGGAGALLMAAVLPLLPLLGQPAEVLAVITPYWLCIAALLIPYTVGMVAKNMLDASDQAWAGTTLTLCAVGFNVFFNWVLIYGNLGFPALGLTGAGIASLLAQLLGTGVLWAYVRFKPSLRAWWAPSRMERAEFQRQWREGLPMTVQYFFEGAAVSVAGIMIGAFGSVALAGNQIAQAVGTTLYMLPLGIAGAVTIRVAQAAGAEESARIGPIGFAGLGVVSVWMGAFALTFLFAGEWIAALFVNDPEVIAAAAAILFVFGFTQLMDGVQSVSFGALRGMLDNQWPTRVSLVAYWLIALPLSALFGFVFGWGAPGVWAGFGVGLAIAAALLARRFLRLQRRFRAQTPMS